MNYSFSKTEILLHLAFWGLLLGFSISLTSQMYPISSAIGLSTKTIVILLAIGYVNAFFVIPNFFIRGRLGWFFLWVILLLFLATVINIWTTEVLFSDPFPRRSQDFPPFRGRRRMPTILGIPLFRIAPVFWVNMVILFISTIYRLAKEYFKSERRNDLLEREKIQHELNFLRSQINPHFLFNALNNLHAVTQLHPEKTGAFILKLGEMLRYILEEYNREKVRLKDEIKYIHNYIFFQQQKDDLFQDIQFNISGDDPSHIELEPMLFINLIENAFIHSYSDQSEHRFISIDLNLEREKLCFTVKNSLPKEEKEQPFPIKVEQKMGLQNMKRRLELLYPGKHSFDHGIRDGKYFAELTLEISKE